MTSVPLAEHSLAAYLDAAASEAPTPGGGSVAALAAALAAAMAAMSARFTLGRKKYAAVAEEIEGVVALADESRAALLRAVDEDALAFAQVGAAYALPKGTPEEQSARRAAVAAASRAALSAPLAVLRWSAKASAALPRLAEIGNLNLISDTGVSAELFHAALRSAALNVAVNLSGLDDPEEASALRRECAAAVEGSARSLAATRSALARRSPAFAGWDAMKG